MEIKNIETQKLINELNRRDLFEELDKDKRLWLKENNFFQSEWSFINLFSFDKDSRCPLYSFEYIKNTPLNEIIKRRNAL